MNNMLSKKSPIVIPAEAGIQDSCWIPAYAGMTRKRNGFTLLEVIIVMALLAIMMGGAMYVLLNSQQTFDEGSMTTFLESQATRAIDMMRDDISESQVITGLSMTVPFWDPMWPDWEMFPCITANSHTLLLLRVPVQNPPGSGSYWNAVTGDIYWGAEGVQNAFIYYFLQSAWPWIPLDEAVDQKDYNQDGDVSDSFLLCEIYRYVWDEGWLWPMLSESVVMNNVMVTWWPNPTFYYGDINNDGIDDPVFSILDKNGNTLQNISTISAAKMVRLNFWLGGKLGAKGNPILVNAKADIVLMNPQ